MLTLILIAVASWCVLAVPLSIAVGRRLGNTQVRGGVVYPSDIDVSYDCDVSPESHCSGER